MTNYEILMNRDMLAAMEERMHDRCWGCVNYERCGEPVSKPSQEACKAMWESYFKGADTPEKLAIRMSESNDCTECPVTGICEDILCECESAILSWLNNKNLLYDMAIGQRSAAGGGEEERSPIDDVKGEGHENMRRNEEAPGVPGYTRDWMEGSIQG